MCEQFTAMQIRKHRNTPLEQHKNTRAASEASEHNYGNIRISFRTESEEKTSNQNNLKHASFECQKEGAA
jgi:hypothetical protein